MTARLPALRSLQNKLALLFLAITALAFAAAIFVVLPRLTTQLQQDRLVELHVNATVRRNRGTDIDAACGQLRASMAGSPIQVGRR